MQNLKNLKQEVLINISDFLEDLIYNTKNNMLIWKANVRNLSIDDTNILKSGYSSDGLYYHNEFTTELIHKNIPKLEIKISFDRLKRHIIIVEHVQSRVDNFYTTKQSKYTVDAELLNNNTIVDLLNTLEELIHIKRSIPRVELGLSDNEFDAIIVEKKYNDLNNILNAMGSIFSEKFQNSIDNVDITNPIFKLKINE